MSKEGPRMKHLVIVGVLLALFLGSVPPHTSAPIGDRTGIRRARPASDRPHRKQVSSKLLFATPEARGCAGSSMGTG
jgi:hypothetical protein